MWFAWGQDMTIGNCSFIASNTQIHRVCLRIFADWMIPETKRYYRRHILFFRNSIKKLNFWETITCTRFWTSYNGQNNNALCTTFIHGTWYSLFWLGPTTPVSPSVDDQHFRLSANEKCEQKNGIRIVKLSSEHTSNGEKSWVVTKNAKFCEKLRYPFDTFGYRRLTFGSACTSPMKNPGLTLSYGG